MFHLDISGKDISDEQFKKTLDILFTLLVFHLDISGKDFKEIHSSNIPDISVTFEISNKDNPFITVNEEHL